MFHRIIKFFYLLLLLSFRGYAGDNASFYVSDNFFSTDHIDFVKVESSEHDISWYRAIYEDCGHRHPWFSCVPFYPDIHQPGSLDQSYVDYLIREGKKNIYSNDHDQIKVRDEEFFKTREKLEFYSQPSSFGDYLLYLRETGSLLGRLIIKGRVQVGRLETGIYILKDFRCKSYSTEILKGVVEYVVEPALQQPFVLSVCRTEDDGTVNVSQQHYKKFSGIFANIDPWLNYPSIAAYINAGYFLSSDYSSISACYPQKNQEGMNLDDANFFKQMMRELYQFMLVMPDLHERTFSQLLQFLKVSKPDSFAKVRGFLQQLSLSSDEWISRRSEHELDLLIGLEDDPIDDREENSETQKF